MEIILYSTGCPKCQVLKKKLDLKEIKYNIITDMIEIKKICEMAKIDTMPILAVCDDKPKNKQNLSELSFYNFSSAVKWVGEYNVN